MCTKKQQGTNLLYFTLVCHSAAVSWQQRWKGAEMCAQMLGLEQKLAPTWWNLGKYVLCLHFLPFLLFFLEWLCPEAHCLYCAIAFSLYTNDFFPPFSPSLFSPLFPLSWRNKHNLCTNVVLSVLISLILINVYPFVPADDQYWVFREADVLPGYPQPLREYGQGVPAHKIDTAIWWEPNGYTYFFSGDRCTCQKPTTRFEPVLKIISAS